MDSALEDMGDAVKKTSVSLLIAALAVLRQEGIP